MNDVTKPKISNVRTAVNQAEIRRHSDEKNLRIHDTQLLSIDCKIRSMYNRLL